MAAGATDFGDISPRTAAFVSKDLLSRSHPEMVTEKFGQAKPIAPGQTDAIKFRRYNALGLITSGLTEGVTPAAQKITHTDVTATLVQYGGLVTLTDKIMDHHEDPVLKEATQILSEQAAQSLETIRFYVLRAGTQVQYTNGAARSAVNTVVIQANIRAAVKTLQRQNAKKLTSLVASTPAYNTFSILGAYWCMCHSDLESDIQDMDGFIDVKDYGTKSAMENEIGSVGKVRFITTTLFTAWADAGGAKLLMESTSGTSADVYPLIIVGKDAYGIVPFKGKGAVTPMVANAKPSDSDPMAQRTHVSWKTSHTAVILNDLWMVRIEAAATA